MKAWAIWEGITWKELLCYRLAAGNWGQSRLCLKDCKSGSHKIWRSNKNEVDGQTETEKGIVEEYDDQDNKDGNSSPPEKESPGDSQDTNINADDKYDFDDCDVAENQVNEKLDESNFSPPIK